MSVTGRLFRDKGGYRNVHIKYNIIFSPTKPQNMVREFMRSHGGLQWVQIRRVMLDAITNPKLDTPLINIIKLRIMPYVPVRSGKLLDTILKSINILRFMFGINKYHVRGMWGWSPDRPYPIQGKVAHSPPDVGYGEWGTVKLTHNIPNVQPLHITANGNALYLLNDPTAFNDPAPIINDIIQEEIQDQIDDLVKNIEIRARITWNPYNKATEIDPVTLIP